MDNGGKITETGLIASVAVDKALYPFDSLYDYLVPDHLAERVRVGMRAAVPFGKGNKSRAAVIFSLSEKEYPKGKVKEISEILEDGSALSEELLELAAWLKENTFCTYFDGIRTILPAGLSFTVSDEYKLADVTERQLIQLSIEELLLLEECKKAGSQKELNVLLADQGKSKIVKALEAKGCLVKVPAARRGIGDETELMVRLSPDYEKNERIDKLSPKQKKAVNTLYQYESASIKELCDICNVTPVVIKNLIKYGIAEEYTIRLSRSVTANGGKGEGAVDIVFSPSQQEVYNGLLSLMKEDKPKCALLHGVTGSGKTSIFIKLINEALEAGKTALMLVPEISLTPQMVEQFQKLFGSRVAIIHSGLSMGHRTDEYLRISAGEARVVIGTRSAVFAPVENIGIIVIDEEGEHTYKSEKSPRYHTRDVAKQRCFRHNALLLLASATPSLDSYYNAINKKYFLFTLNERYNKAVLPEVYMVDMRVEAENGNRSNFSEVLIHELGENLSRGEQSLLLLNRRGYHTYASCVACGQVLECPNCSVPLTYHKTGEQLMCHLCGYAASMPEKCPSCGSRYIHQSGTGTERIEDEIRHYFPAARILRMDADTTGTKNAFADGFQKFGRGEFDIMVGTQMIAKGLDFENVTLVGVLLIDKALYAGDYMGYERAFSLITQVVGRSGRGSKRGRAYIQTFVPEHYVLQLAASQNYREFYDQEIDVRQALLFPPFCDICLVCFSSLSESDCVRGARRFTELFAQRMKREEKLVPIRILGPTKSGSGRLGGRYRYKLVMKCKFNRQFRRVMNDVMAEAYKDRSFETVSFYVDINGDIV